MYPASRIPVLTIMSAAERTSASVTCSAKWFQLFQPIGGVAASCWLKAGAAKSRAAQERAASVRMGLNIDVGMGLALQRKRLHWRETSYRFALFVAAK